MNEQSTDPADSELLASRNGLLSVRVCAIMLILYALYYARSLAIPVVTAVVLYLTLRPIIRHARRIGIPSAVSAAGIIVGIALTLGLGTYLVIEPAKATIAEAPQHLGVVKEKLSFITDRLKEVDKATEELAEAEEESTGGSQEEQPVPVEIKQPTWTSGWSYLSGTGNLVSFLTICIAMLYFLLANGDSLLRSIMHSLPDFTARRKLVEVIQKVQEGLGSYLAKISTINACLGLSVGIAMWGLGMPSPVLWGAMAFAFNFIPILGAIAGGAIVFVVALVSFEATYYAFLVAATFLTLTSLEGQFITPAILGRSMSMSPVLVFLSIVVWGWMWGVMGVFLSVPMLIAARMACEGYEGLGPLAMILGAEVPESKSASASGRGGSDSTADNPPAPQTYLNIVQPSVAGSENQ
ncbi:AI-2E family transporter [Rosistilla oblonga]|uniref:Pheromone autoinducer 2 transporter n=1 Tax=Rosistilla oblonga TaxID=2527990 RepID=A0A518IM86_9BACT|nr:AI-2E family transporter [Rosistilla oblonga]QDV54210.1 pheromone autoinducer 2 transporter [Rosistilla oblonga]